MSLELRVRLPGNTPPETLRLDPATSWADFVASLAARLNVAPGALRLLAGYPPRPLAPTPSDSDSEGGGGLTPLCALLKPRASVIVQVGAASVVRGVDTGRYVPPANDRWHFTRRLCPGDNSCLFHAAAYVLRDKSRTEGPQLREECAAVVLAYPQHFNEAMLERPNREYAEWIRNPSSWGGAIELMILSFLSQTEIIALDLESSRMERFGQDMEYTVRAFVVYTGKHYDAIAMNAMYNSPRENEDQVLFNVRDENVISRAERFVREEAKRIK